MDVEEFYTNGGGCRFILYFSEPLTQTGVNAWTKNMNSRPRFIMFLTIIVILTIVSTSYGQDAYEEPSLIEAEAFRIDGDKILSTPGDTDFRFTPSKTNTKALAKDTASVAAPANTAVSNPAKVKIEKQSPKQTVQKQSKEEDESIMSFHFLYYMIQKYKLQDIVE